MIGTLASAAVGAIGSIFGGVKAAKEAQQARQQVEDQRQKNQNWRDRNYNEDFLRRADAQRLLNITQERLRRNTQAAAGSAAVSGASEESIATTKAANNQALADATAQIASNASERKDQIDAAYRQADDAYANQLAGHDAQKAHNIAGATQAVTQTAAQIADAYIDDNRKS